MKPLTEPSAYRETISPMCRKLEAESDILQLILVVRQRQKAQVHKVKTFSRRLLPGAPTHLNFNLLACNWGQRGASACPTCPEESSGATATLFLAAFGVFSDVDALPSHCELQQSVCGRVRARPQRQTPAIKEEKPGSRRRCRYKGARRVCVCVYKAKFCQKRVKRHFTAGGMWTI